MNYQLFYRFAEQYLPDGFTGIDPAHPVVSMLDNQLEADNQSFYVADLLKVKILYCDKRLGPMIGLPFEVPASQVDPSSFILSTHPDDAPRHERAFTKLIALGFSMRSNPEKTLFYCVHFRMKDTRGVYNHLLFQGYLFRTPEEGNNVYVLMVISNINQLISKHPGIFYYMGTDRNFFRNMDEEMLKSKIHLSHREISILEQVSRGLTSEQIAKQMFLSTHTVSTHRRNVLKKNGANTTNELIFNLKEAGVL
jgi:DNA-binding CsgD family transcriptional regulator